MAVAPGDIATPMMKAFTQTTGLSVESLESKHPVGRVDWRSVAELIAFLLLDCAAFMTGAIAAMDGVLTAWGYYSLDEME